MSDLPDITYHIRRGALRPVRLLADAASAYRAIRLAGDDDRPYQAIACYLLRRALASAGEGDWEVESKPDETERQRKAPDYLLRERAGGARMAVETSQILGFPEQLQQRSVYVELHMDLARTLVGRLRGSFDMLCPIVPANEKRGRRTLSTRLSEGILSCDAELRPGEFRMLAGSFAALKVLDDGASLALSTLMLRPGMSRTGPPIAHTKGDLTDQLTEILGEAREKFKSTPDLETAVVLQAHLDIAPGTDLASAIGTLDVDRSGVSRLYAFDSPDGFFGRAW